VLQKHAHHTLAAQAKSACAAIKYGRLRNHSTAPSSLSSLKKASSSSCTVCAIATCLVDRPLRARTLTKAAKENIATTPKSGKAQAGTMLDSVFGVAACCTSVIPLASYLRATGDAVAQGLEGATGTGAAVVQGLPGVGAGVVVTVVTTGGGVVVTVVTTGGGVVVTVVMMTVQHVAKSH